MGVQGHKIKVILNNKGAVEFEDVFLRDGDKVSKTYYVNKSIVVSFSYSSI